MSKQQVSAVVAKAVNQIQLFVGFNVGSELVKALDVVNVKLPKTAVVFPEGHKKVGQQRKNKKGKLMFRGSKDYTEIRVLPATAGEDKPSIAVKTGLVGQDLFTFERDAKREASLQYLAAVTQMLSSGDYNLSRCRLNNKNKVLSSTLKPNKELLLPVITEQQAMDVVAKSLGITVEALAAMKPATATIQ